MQIDTFLARWRHATGSECANYQLLISNLCELLEVNKPQPAEKSPWRATRPEQVTAISQTLADSTNALSEADIASRFTSKCAWKKCPAQPLETLVALGHARISDDNRLGTSK